MKRPSFQGMTGEQGMPLMRENRLKETNRYLGILTRNVQLRHW